MMDADGQHPVPVLAQMLQLGEGGADMVAAIQAERPHEGGLMRLLKRGFYRFMQDNARYEIRPSAGDFRLMRRKVVNALLALPERQRFMKVSTPCICPLPPRRARRGAASSTTPA